MIEQVAVFTGSQRLDGEAELLSGLLMDYMLRDMGVERDKPEGQDFYQPG